MRTRPGEAPAAARLRGLADVAGCLGVTADVAALAGLVVDHAAWLVGDAATMWLLRTGEDVLVCADATHPDPAASRELRDLHANVRHRTADPVTRAVLATGEAMLVTGADLADHLGQLHPDDLPWLDRHGISSLAALPMRSGGRVVGTLVVTRDAGKGPPTDDDIVFLQALADIAAAAVDRARLVQDSATAQEELRRQSELVDYVSDAVVVLDHDQRVVSWNAGAERIYGYFPGEVLDCDLFALLATQFQSTDGLLVDRETVVEQTGRTGGWRGELRERRVDGAETEILASFSALPASGGGPGGMIVVNRDVTEQRHKEHQANHDPLTGLPNRARMDDCLRRAIDRANRSGTTMAVVFMDLNGFKAVNDRLGHEAGDRVLQVTASRLADAVRGSDVVVRLGGDEFVVIAENLSLDAASLLGRRLLAATSEPIVVGDEAVTVPLSIGIALSAGGRQQPDDLLRAADTAMYEAKAQRTGIAFAAF